jgi:hypothetical protein
MPSPPTPAGGKGENEQKPGALGVATTVVGLLAGIVAVIYVLGGLVIALRLLFDHFSPSSVVAIVGQLPRELVVTTAMLDVIAPAAAFGLLVLVIAGVGRQVRDIVTEPRERSATRETFVWLALGLVGLVLIVPAIVEVLSTDGVRPALLMAVFPYIATVLLARVCWEVTKGLDRWQPIAALAAIGALWTAVAVIPATMFAAALPFEHAQVCTSSSQVAETGLLIGEGGGRVLLEEEFGTEASVLSLPVDQVTKSEYGDLSSLFSCPPPPGTPAPKVAAAALGGHGSPEELRLATLLRPRLRFDSRERWRPLEVGAFAAERFPGGAGHGACPLGDDPPCPSIGGLGELRRGPGALAYLDIEGNRPDGDDFASPDAECQTSPPALDCNAGPATTIYYRRTSHLDRWYWDYWWFLRYNDYTGPGTPCPLVCGDHEGDWEGISVITTPSLEPEIVGAIYAAHRARVLVDGATLPLSAGHPIVYVAEGTHASYPFGCRGGCRQYGSGAARLPEDPHDGAVAWGGNRDGECAAIRCVRPLPEIGHPSDTALPLAGRWAGWPGHWGATCHNGCGGIHGEASPGSPGGQSRFECPWSPTRRALPAADGSGLSDSEPVGDAERIFATCLAQRGGR